MIKVPPLPTRRQVADILELSIEQVKRLDYDGAIRRVPAFRKPVRYYGESVAEFALGGRRRFYREAMHNLVFREDEQ